MDNYIAQFIDAPSLPTPAQQGVFLDPDLSKPMVGQRSTSAKLIASNAAHHNEIAYGIVRDDYDNDEALQYLVNWSLLRGVQVIRPQSEKQYNRWQRSDSYSKYLQRMGWLNSGDLSPVRVAVYCDDQLTPHEVPQVLYQGHINFHYLHETDLLENAQVSETGIDIAQQHYDVLVIDQNKPDNTTMLKIKKLAIVGRVLTFRQKWIELDPLGAVMTTTADELLGALQRLVSLDVSLEPAATGLRVRHVIRSGAHWWMLFNEMPDAIDATLQLPIAGKRYGIDPMTGEVTEMGEVIRLMLPAYQTAVLCVGE